MIFSDQPFLVGLGLVIIINIYLYDLLVRDHSQEGDKQGSTLAPPDEEDCDSFGDSGGSCGDVGGGWFWRFRWW